MSQRYCRFLLIIALLILTPSLFSGLIQQNIRESDKVISIQFATSYESHAPIAISSNADFESQEWPGNGSATNPYLIENLSIVSDWRCIRVVDTTAFFIIRNCQFSALSPNDEWGVELFSVQNGRIENCTFFNFDYGFALARSVNCTFILNNLSDCNFGTALFQSLNCSFSENTFTSCGFSSSDDSLEWYAHSFSNNLVNGKKFGYFLNETDLTIDGSLYGQIFLVGCNNTSINSGSFNDTTVGVNMFGCFNSSLVSATITQNYYGVNLYQSLNCSIICCNITENRLYPITISHSEGSLFSNNLVFSNNADEGAIRLDSENCTFISNVFYDNSDYGVIDGGHGTTIVNNSFYGHPRSGVWFYFADDLLIVNNSFYGNDYAGLELQDSENSLIYLNKFGWNLITNVWDNDVTGSNYDPNDWDNGTIGNYWDDYSGTGVYEVPSGSLTDDPIDHFPHVLVDDTSPTLSHPSDEEIEFGVVDLEIHWTTSDQFPLTYEILVNSSLVKSAYWRNGEITFKIKELDVGLHNFTIVVSDGAGNLASDTVYIAAVDTAIPLLSLEQDFEYELGSTGNNVSWTAVDPHPGDYLIYIDETIQFSGEWISSESITFNVDHLDSGAHNITAVFSDHFENSESDEILVDVIDTTPPSITPPSNIEVERGFESVTVNWNVFDIEPSSFEIYINGTLAISKQWTGTLISIVVNETEADYYLLELRVYDTSDNSEIDVLSITVLEVPTTTTTTTTTTTSVTSTSATTTISDSTTLNTTTSTTSLGDTGNTLALIGILVGGAVVILVVVILIRNKRP